MGDTKIRIFIFADGGVNIDIETPARVRNVSAIRDLGYEENVRTYEDEEEGILYDNLD